MLIGGALAVLIVAVGVQITVHQVHQNRLARAQNYETAVQNMDAAALRAMAARGRGGMSDLAMFQSYAMDGDAAKLDDLMAHGATRDFRDLARIHLAARRGDDMTAADLQKFLDPITPKKSPFYYTGRLMLAQKYLAAGDRDAGVRILDLIIADTDAPAVISASATALR